MFQGLRDPKRGNQLLNLPLQTPNLRAFLQDMELVVQSPKGVTVSCHILHHICQFHVSGISTSLSSSCHCALIIKLLNPARTQMHLNSTTAVVSIFINVQDGTLEKLEVCWGPWTRNIARTELRAQVVATSTWWMWSTRGSLVMTQRLLRLAMQDSAQVWWLFVRKVVMVLSPKLYLSAKRCTVAPRPVCNPASPR